MVKAEKKIRARDLSPPRGWHEVPGGNVDVENSRSSASSNLVRTAEKLSRRTGLFLLLMVEAEKKVIVGDNSLSVNDISIYLWEIFPIDKCLTCCVSGRYSPRPDTKGGGGIGKHP